MKNLFNPEIFEAILKVATIVVAIRLIFDFLKRINRFVPWQMWTCFLLMLCVIYIHKTYIEPESVAMLASVLVLIAVHLFARIPDQKKNKKTTTKDEENGRDVKLNSGEISTQNPWCASRRNTETHTQQVKPPNFTDKSHTTHA